MATIVQHAYGTADEIELALQAVTPSVELEKYDGRAAAASPPSPASQAIFDDPMSSPGPVGGSLRVDSGFGNTGTARMGAQLPAPGAPVDMTNNPAVRLYIRFNASGFAALSALTNNIVRLYSDEPGNAAFQWLFDPVDIGQADTWAQLVLPFSTATPLNSPNRAAITHTEVAWAANPATTDGSEQMWLDNMVITLSPQPIYAVNFRPEGGGTNAARAWVVYDDGN